MRRALPDEPEGMSVIAGYHWFGDWGRDTNALWYDALCAMTTFARGLGRPADASEALASRVRQGFDRCWYEAGG